MGVPLIQKLRVGGYILKQRLKGNDRYPLVLMLEPLFRCTLACAGCGKIDYPADILNQRLSVEDCLQAAEECGAPVVSIPGGEPLLHREIVDIVEGLTARKKFVYLCTNAQLLERKLHRFKPSPYLTFSVHLDGNREDHDAAVCQDGVFDQAVSAIFLDAVQPARLETMLEALSVLEQERQTLDRQWQLRLQQARYEVRLAQRQYDAVDPEHRLVAYELEKRWNEALLSLNHLEQEYAQVQQDELAPLTEAEQLAVHQLAQDLPALWYASTTSDVDRKRLLRLVIREVTVTVHPETRSADFAILWSGEVITHHSVTCPPIGWHCVTDNASLGRIRELALLYPDHRIAEILNEEGVKTQTGKLWTYRRVQSMRKQHHIPTACPLDPHIPLPRGDGLVSAARAAELLHVSPATVHLWAAQGILASDQRVRGSKLWVRVSDADLTRLDGALSYTHLPTVADVAAEHQITRDAVWALVRAGYYLVYRARNGQSWEWRLEKLSQPEHTIRIQSVVSHEEGIPHYG